MEFQLKVGQSYAFYELIGDDDKKAIEETRKIKVKENENDEKEEKGEDIGSEDEDNFEEDANNAPNRPRRGY